MPSDILYRKMNKADGNLWRLSKLHVLNIQALNIIFSSHICGKNVSNINGFNVKKLKKIRISVFWLEDKGHNDKRLFSSRTLKHTKC